ncbi:MbtH family protein [Gloeobacter morelensis]|uniref:MbtH family NRPS accessory protein n=1 Tax=Gloeobacter morelensis MG652769 TaxID=2781736 RepID=A0ABY3PR00_9CYAN|nr:MbtH family NRPS accessory protein [Gloeobacter morelensis]UFP96155.1 MbtH family NRPS accessory protein [Gloeobacter morelensis MG652769]
MTQPIGVEAPQDLYQVVVNHEEQYSIWAVGDPPPLGWLAAGKRGSKAECLAHIDAVWLDMRPLSLRKQEPATDNWDETICGHKPSS